MFYKAFRSDFQLHLNENQKYFLLNRRKPRILRPQPINSYVDKVKPNGAVRPFYLQLIGFRVCDRLFHKRFATSVVAWY